MSLKVQSDAIRVALLKKYGGIWMDPDTIVLNGKFINNLKNFELAIIGTKLIKYQFIGFIYANNNSSILNEWLKKIIDKIKFYKNILKKKINTNIRNDIWKKVNYHAYLGNDIIDPIIKNASSKIFFSLDFEKINVFPERIILDNSSLDNLQKYRLFYFQKGDPQKLFEISKYIILLHNSWTPIDYKNLSENEFLKKDILLSKLLKKILNKKI